jgi:hypothetical protein
MCPSTPSTPTHLVFPLSDVSEAQIGTCQNVSRRRRSRKQYRTLAAELFSTPWVVSVDAAVAHSHTGIGIGIGIGKSIR